MPKAEAASRRAASTAPERSSACSTRRMPRPPPPETAFTNSGKPISAAQRAASVSDDNAGDCARVGTPAASAAPRAAIFEPASSSTSGVGPTKVSDASSQALASVALSERNP